MGKKYIPAGAGSGKTYKLTHMLADMLAPKGEEQPVEASRIILTTFTKSAAADFVRRAREVLINEKGSPALAAGLDSALIGTVHSVCERFVKKYWYRLDLTLPLNTLSNEDRALFMSRTSESVASDADVKSFSQFAREFEMVPEFWKGYLRDIIEKKYNFGVKDLAASKMFSCKDIDKVFTRESTQEEKDDMKAFVDRVLSFVVSDLVLHPDNNTGKKRKKELEELRDGSDLLRAREIIKIINLDEKMVYTRGYWRKFESMGWDLVGTSLAAEHYLVSTEVGESMKDCVNKLFDLAIVWEEKYRTFKSENRLLDFNDMEQKFLQLLEEDEDVRKDIQNSYDVMMVDEFQDSNPVQIKIFRELMALVKESVFVGDSKQAIYGFRGTESTLVDDFIRDIKDQKALKESYRSRPELVEAANDIFCLAFTGRPKLPVFPKDDSKPYDGVSLAPARKEIEGLQPALQHWDTPASGDSVKNNYDAVGKKIRDLVDSKRCMVVRKDNDEEYPDPIQYRDIALLVRNNTSIVDAVPALRKAGVPVSIQEKEFVCWAEVQLIMSMVRYVFDDGDKCAWADILRLVGGKSTIDIIRDTAANRQTDLEKILLDSMGAIRSRLSVLSVSEVVESLILELDMNGHVKDWGLPDTRTRNIGFMVDLARKYEQQCEILNVAPTLPGYLAYVSEFETETHPVDKTNTVKVLTCHNAKGLDWPMVILDELDSLKTDDESVFRKGFSGVCNVRDGSDVLLRLFPRWRNSSSFAKLPAPVLKRLSGSELLDPVRQRKIEEERRLLYVGFTRAKDYLVTLGNMNSTYSWLMQCKAGCDPSLVGNDFYLWHSGHPSAYIELQLPEDVENQDAREPMPWVVPEQKDFGEKYLSPSKSGHQGKVQATLSEEFRGVEMEQNIPDDKTDICGTCIHHIFAAYDMDADRKEMVDMAARIIDGMGLNEAFPSPESVIDSAAQFFGWMRENYGPGTPLHELPFLLRNDDGTIVRGEMDLVWQLSDRECVLVDYKSYHRIDDFNDPDAYDKYYGYANQLKYYKDTLEKPGPDYPAGLKVRYVLIYYFVQGRVIRFEL